MKAKTCEVFFGEKVVFSSITGEKKADLLSEDREYRIGKSGILSEDFCNFLGQNGLKPTGKYTKMNSDCKDFFFTIEKAEPEIVRYHTKFFVSIFESRCDGVSTYPKFLDILFGTFGGELLKYEKVHTVKKGSWYSELELVTKAMPHEVELCMRSSLCHKVEIKEI